MSLDLTTVTPQVLEDWAQRLGDYLAQVNGVDVPANVAEDSSAGDPAAGMSNVIRTLNALLDALRQQKQVGPPSYRGSTGLSDAMEQISTELHRLGNVSASGMTVFNTPTGIGLAVRPNETVAAGSSTQGIRFGKPTEAYEGGSTIELDPCDVSGADLLTGDNSDFITANMPSGHTMLDGATVPIAAIVPYVIGGDGEPYVLGSPKVVMTNWRFDFEATHEAQGTFMDDFGFFHGTESDWLTLETAVPCPGSS